MRAPVNAAVATLLERAGADYHLLTAVIARAIDPTDPPGGSDFRIPAERWPPLVHLAGEHGVLPLLSAAVGEAHPGEVDEATSTRLRYAYHAARLRNRALLDELFTVLDALADTGIEAIPMRGPVLSAMIYGDPALRTSGDLDLLLRPDTVSAAAERLAELGYRPHPHPRPAVQLIGGPADTVVELHREVLDLRYATSFNHADLWERTHRVEMQGRMVPWLDPADLLLTLSMHGVKHRWGRLSWICDIARLIHCTPQLDWGSVLQRARRQRVQRALLASLVLASAVLGAPVPGDVLRMASPPGVTRVIALMRLHHHTAPALPRGPFPRLRRPLRKLQSAWRQNRLALALREHPRDSLFTWVTFMPWFLDRFRVSLNGAAASS